MDTLTIGEVATAVGVNVQTIRYYERRELLPKPRRTNSNYRLYGDDTLRRVRFIKQAQELGFTLKEMHELLALREAPRACRGGMRKLAVKHLASIEAKLQLLEEMRKSMSRLVAACSERGSSEQCPILNDLKQASVPLKKDRKLPS